MKTYDNSYNAKLRSMSDTDLVKELASKDPRLWEIYKNSGLQAVVNDILTVHVDAGQAIKQVLVPLVVAVIFIFIITKI